MKTLALSLLALVLLLQYRLWVSDSGMREVWRLRREVATQQDANDLLKERNRTLAAEVQDLKKGKSAIEERARTDLGMVGSNETFFQVAPTAKAAQSPQSSAAAETEKDSGSTTATADKAMLTGIQSNKLGGSSALNGTPINSQIGSH